MGRESYCNMEKNVQLLLCNKNSGVMTHRGRHMAEVIRFDKFRSKQTHIEFFWDSRENMASGEVVANACLARRQDDDARNHHQQQGGVSPALCTCGYHRIFLVDPNNSYW